MLTFSEDPHAYHWNGKKIPGVTDIIGQWQEISVYGIKYFASVFDGLVLSEETFRQARDFGNAVHKIALFSLNDNELDMESLHPSLHKPLVQLNKWRDEWKPVILEVERPMYSAKYGYAGKPDIVCLIRKRLCVVDIKTGMYGMAGPQIAAYEQLYREYRKTWARIDRYVLHLPKDEGAYRFVQMKRQNDMDFFLSRYYQYKFLRAA